MSTIFLLIGITATVICIFFFYACEKLVKNFRDDTQYALSMFVLRDEIKLSYFLVVAAFIVVIAVEIIRTINLVSGNYLGLVNVVMYGLIGYAFLRLAKYTSKDLAY